jgi:chaperonin cofactor prefoldin
MDVEETTELANRIAKLLMRLRTLTEQKLSIQKRLEELKVENQRALDELNKIEESVRVVKYEINESLNDKPRELKIVGE